MDSTQTPCDSNDLHQPSTEQSLSAPSDDGKIDNDGTSDLSDGWQINLPLGNCMQKLFDEQLWTDVAFRCVDQSEENRDDRVHAHKIVLAARSPVFQAMFFGSFQDNNAEIEIRDTNSNEFKMFIRLLYSDDFNLYDSYEDLTGILSIAHTYQVQVIVDKCCRKLEKTIRYDNACALLERALLYESRYLINTVSDFIDGNAERVLLTDGFLEMSLQCLTHILKGDTFLVKEADIFNRVIEWAEQRCKSTDGMTLRQTLGEAFYYLRTPSMTATEFMACTKRKGYYSVGELEDMVGIFGCTEKAQQEIECNSSCKRIPLQIVVKRPDTSIASASDTSTCKTISDMVTITPNVPVYLLCLELYDFTMAKLEQSKRVQKTKACVRCYNGISFDENVVISDNVSIRDMIFSVNINISGADKEQMSDIISGSGPSTIKLPKHLLLSPGISYELTVTIQLKALYNQLEIVYPPRRDKAIFTGISSDVLCVETNHTPGLTQAIRNLTFEGISNRNLK